MSRFNRSHEIATPLPLRRHNQSWMRTIGAGLCSVERVAVAVERQRHDDEIGFGRRPTRIVHLVTERHAIVEESPGDVDVRRLLLDDRQRRLRQQAPQDQRRPRKQTAADDDDARGTAAPQQQPRNRALVRREHEPLEPR